MYEKNRSTDPYFDERCALEPGESLYWLVGKPINGVDVGTMMDIWRISGKYILEVYWRTLRQREGDR